MGSQSVAGSRPMAASEALMVGNRESNDVEAGGVEPQALDPLGVHALGHGPAHHVPRRQLVHEPLAPGVPQQGAVAPQRLGEQRAGHGRMVQGGRVELHELDVGHRDPGPQRHGQPVAGGLGRVGGDREDLPGAPGGQHGVGGPHLDDAAVGVEGHHPPAPAALHQQVEGEPLLEHGGGRGPGGVDQGPLDLGAGRRPAGVDHPGRGVAALAGEGQRPARAAGRRPRPWR